MNIEKFMLCEISDMDEYVGDFVISETLAEQILAYPIIRQEYADETLLTTAIRTIIPESGDKILIDIMNPARFFRAQISALMGKISYDAAIALEAYKTEHLARTALKERYINAA